MIALAFLAFGGGLVLSIAGVTGSSIRSVMAGHPDHANEKEIPAGEGGGAGGVSGAAVAPGKAGGLLAAAQTQIGVPYRWGGEIEKVAFDCSGLVQWAAGKAGVKLPRVAQAQFNATQRISPAEASEGDLVFFGSSANNVTHVGIVAGTGIMLDAPHTGSNVRYEHFPTAIGSLWGTDRVIGYGRA